MGLVRSDGVRLPLTLSISDIAGSRIEGRQILLASGVVPPGSYTGVYMTIENASVTREDGPAALLVPKEPLDIPASFDLRPSEVFTLFLTLDGSGLVKEGFEFSPSFSLNRPVRDLTSLIGYVAIPEADRIIVFNRKTMLITDSLATGRNPQAIAVDGRSGLAYVALTGEDAIQVMDISHGTMGERIYLRNGDEPVDLALTRDGRTLLAANFASDTVSIIDPILGAETERLQVDRGPAAVIVNEIGTRAYVPCSRSSTLSVLDLSTGTLSTSLPLDERTPFDAALDRDEERLFVVSRDSPHLAVVDTASLQVTDRIYVGMGSNSILVDDLSGLVLVGRKYSNEIALIDPSALMPVDSVKLEGPAGSMALDRQENALLVSLPEKEVIQKVDLVSKRVMAELQTDLAPSEVAVVE
jgi:YVTN family beta-propeller protein